VADRWASFDCYGTLIDWESGLRETLARLWPAADAHALVEAYHEVEPRVQLESARPYREVLRESLRLLAEREGLELDPSRRDALAESLPQWPPFAEVPAELAEVRERGWRIAILSNTDPEFLAASLERIGVPADATVTAREAGSYKPAHGHWERFFERGDVDRRRHVPVAQSAFHDLGPAAELGVPAVWINRRRETSDRPRAAELPNLTGLADTLDSLVPATF